MPQSLATDQLTAQQGRITVSSTHMTAQTQFKYMRGSGKFCQRGSNSDKFVCFFLFVCCFFFVFFFFFFFGGGLMRGKRIQIALRAVHHQPASETPLNGVSLQADDGPTLNASLVAL